MDMKTTSEYMALLRKYMVENAHKYGIMRMGIFGSVAREEQTEDSDVDVCVELQTPSMFCLVHIKDELQHSGRYDETKYLHKKDFPCKNRTGYYSYIK